MEKVDKETKLYLFRFNMIKDSIRVEFEMEQQMSPQAKRFSDEYYELKLQLRFSYFSDEELHNDIMKEKRDKFGNIVVDGNNRPVMIKQKAIMNKFAKLVEKEFSGINKVEELAKGYDFFFGSLGEMGKISRYFNKYFLVESKHSKKIVGKDFLKFKDIWRHTLLINILNLEVGDKVRIKGTEYYIKAFNKKELVLREWESGAKEVVTYAKIKDYFELLEKYAWSKGKGKVEYNDE